MRASPCGAISLVSNSFSFFLHSSSGRIVAPRCFFHWQLIGCPRNILLRSKLCCFRNRCVVAPIAIFLVECVIGGRSRNVPLTKIELVCCCCLQYCLGHAFRAYLHSLKLSQSFSESSSHLPSLSLSSSRGSTLPPLFAFLCVIFPHSIVALMACILLLMVHGPQIFCCLP